MKENHDDQISHSSIKTLCIYLQSLNQVYYGSPDTINIDSAYLWSEALIQVIQESIKLGLIKSDRFSKTGQLL